MGKGLPPELQVKVAIGKDIVKPTVEMIAGKAVNTSTVTTASPSSPFSRGASSTNTQSARANTQRQFRTVPATPATSTLRSMIQAMPTPSKGTVDLKSMKPDQICALLMHDELVRMGVRFNGKGEPEHRIDTITLGLARANTRTRLLNAGLKTEEVTTIMRSLDRKEETSKKCEKCGGIRAARDFTPPDSYGLDTNKKK